ncbi:unnamed protein product, partial [Amoebophrya sp. A120]
YLHHFAEEHRVFHGEYGKKYAAEREMKNGHALAKNCNIALDLLLPEDPQVQRARNKEQKSVLPRVVMPPAPEEPSTAASTLSPSTPSASPVASCVSGATQEPSTRESLADHEEELDHCEQSSSSSKGAPRPAPSSSPNLVSCSSGSVPDTEHLEGPPHSPDAPASENKPNLGEEGICAQKFSSAEHEDQDTEPAVEQVDEKQGQEDVLEEASIADEHHEQCHDSTSTQPAGVDEAASKNKDQNSSTAALQIKPQAAASSPEGKKDQKNARKTPPPPTAKELAEAKARAAAEEKAKREAAEARTLQIRLRAGRKIRERNLRSAPVRERIDRNSSRNWKFWDDDENPYEFEDPGYPVPWSEIFQMGNLGATEDEKRHLVVREVPRRERVAPVNQKALDRMNRKYKAMQKWEINYRNWWVEAEEEYNNSYANQHDGGEQSCDAEEDDVPFYSFTEGEIREKLKSMDWSDRQLRAEARDALLRDIWDVLRRFSGSSSGTPVTKLTSATSPSAPPQSKKAKGKGKNKGKGKGKKAGAVVRSAPAPVRKVEPERRPPKRPLPCLEQLYKRAKATAIITRKALAVVRERTKAREVEDGVEFPREDVEKKVDETAVAGKSMDELKEMMANVLQRRRDKDNEKKRVEADRQRKIELLEKLVHSSAMEHRTLR